MLYGLYHVRDKRKCGCQLIGNDVSSNEPSFYDYCNSSDFDCTSSMGDEDLMSCQTCSIPQCIEQVYSTQYSPGLISQNTAKYAKKIKDASIDKLSINFAAIHINYDPIRYEETTKSKSTSPLTLFSNLGVALDFSWKYP